MRAVRIKAFGQLTEVLHLVDLSDPPGPAAGEVLVGVEYAPINMNDLYLIQGIFPVRPSLPSVVGNEGVGRILAVGNGVEAPQGQRSGPHTALCLQLARTVGCACYRAIQPARGRSSATRHARHQFTHGAAIARRGLRSEAWRMGGPKCGRLRRWQVNHRDRKSAGREGAIYPTQPAFPEWARCHRGLYQAGRAHTLRGQTRRHRWRSGLCARALPGWGGQETVGVDIFRFDADGKVVEHWDVLQRVPASSNNDATRELRCRCLAMRQTQWECANT
jgi:Alcohol dehydrogenase GroES-like domain